MEEDRRWKVRCPLLPPGYSICLWTAYCQFTKHEACVRPYLFASDGLPKFRAKGTARQSCILSPLPSPPPSPKLLAGHWYEQQFPVWMPSLTHSQKIHTCSTKKHAHTLTVAGYLGMYKTWACACAHTHIFISCSLVGSLPGLQQSLTEETEDFPGWATFYQLYWITMQTQLPPPDIFSIFNMRLTPSFLSVKSSLLFPASLFHSPLPSQHCHYHPLVNFLHATQGVGRKWLWLGVVRSTVEAMCRLAVVTVRMLQGGRHRAPLNPPVAV